MVFWRLFAILAGFDGSIYRSLKSFPLIISEYRLKLTSGPIFLIIFIDMADTLKE